MLYELSPSILPQTNRISYQINTNDIFSECSSDEGSDANPAASLSLSSEKPIAVRSSVLFCSFMVERGRPRIIVPPLLSVNVIKEPTEISTRSLFPLSPSAIDNCLTLWNEVSLYFQPLTQSHIDLMLGSDLHLPSSAASSSSLDETVVDRLLSCLVSTAEPVCSPRDGQTALAEREEDGRAEEAMDRARSKALEPFVAAELGKLGLMCEDKWGNGEENEGNGEENEGNGEENEGNGEENGGNEEEKEGNGEENGENGEENGEKGEEKEGNGEEKEGNGEDKWGNVEEGKNGGVEDMEMQNLVKEVEKLREERKKTFEEVKEKCFEEIRREKRAHELDLKDRWVMRRWEESTKRIRLNGFCV